MGSESRLVVVKEFSEGGTQLSLILDLHRPTLEPGATRVGWVISGERGDGRLTVAEAVEQWCEVWAASYRTSKGELPPEIEREAFRDAAEMILESSLEALLLRDVVPAWPEFGGAARAFWVELVEAASRFPEAVVGVLYEQGMVLRSLLERRRGEGD